MTATAYVRRVTLISGLCVAMAVAIVGCGGSSADKGTLAARTPPLVKDAKGFRCLKSNGDSLGRCPANPNFGKTRAQVRAQVIAKAKAAQRASIAKARAARLARIEAARVAGGKVVRTRPLCAYPEVAKYKGSGSIDEAANFTCRKP